MKMLLRNIALKRVTPSFSVIFLKVIIPFPWEIFAFSFYATSSPLNTPTKPKTLNVKRDTSVIFIDTPFFALKLIFSFSGFSFDILFTTSRILS